MPSQDVWKFTPVSYRTSAPWGCCPAFTPLLQLITPSRASGTADHVRSLDDLLVFKTKIHKELKSQKQDFSGKFDSNKALLKIIY